MTAATTSKRPLTRDAEPSPDVVGAGGRRVAAVLLDAVLALLPLVLVPVLGLTRLSPAWVWTLAAAAVIAVVTALFVDLARTGRTPGRRLIRLRTVATETDLPPKPSQVLRRHVVTADLRAGRDPLRLVPQPFHPFEPASRDGWQQPAGSATGSWRLILDNGVTIDIERPTLLGRTPTNEDGSDHALVAIPDLTRSISRVHALIEPADDCVWLTDAGATNGTRAASPSASGGTVIERWLRSGERVDVRAGGTIHLGDRELRVTRTSRPGA